MIDFHLEVLGTRLLFFVRKMDEDQRCKNAEEPYTFISTNKIVICSQAEPNVLVTESGTVREVQLRGSITCRRNNMCTVVFESEQQATEQKRRILSALAEWVERRGFHPRRFVTGIDMNATTYSF